MSLAEKKTGSMALVRFSAKLCVFPRRPLRTAFSRLPVDVSNMLSRLRDHFYRAPSRSKRRLFVSNYYVFCVDLW